MVSTTNKYNLSPNQVSSNIANETVILNHKDGIYYSLNEVGTFIWELLKEKPYSVEEIVTAILEEFEIDVETAKTDVQGILTDLLHEKLLEISQ